MRGRAVRSERFTNVHVYSYRVNEKRKTREKKEKENVGNVEYAWKIKRSTTAQVLHFVDSARTTSTQIKFEWNRATVYIRDPLMSYFGNMHDYIRSDVL